MKTRRTSGNKFFLFDGLTPSDKLLPNNVEFDKNEGFSIISDGLAKYPKSPSIDVELTDLEIIDSLDLIFGRNSDIVRSLNKDLHGTLKSLEYELEKEFDITINMGTVYESMPRVKDFIDMVSLGVVVGLNYTSVLGFPYKLFYLSPRVGKSSIYVRTTNQGRMFKNIPVITEVNRTQINTAMDKFYQDFLKASVIKTGGDYFKYFLTTMPDQDAVRKIRDIADTNQQDNLDMARVLSDNAFDPNFARKMESQIGKKRMNLVVSLAKLLK